LDIFTAFLLATDSGTPNWRRGGPGRAEKAGTALLSSVLAISRLFERGVYIVVHTIRAPNS
jgi:hypothetical protein